MTTPYSFDKPYDLTPSQKVSFQENGFLVLDDVLTPSQVKDLQAWTAEVKNWPARPGEHMPYEERRADGSTGLCRTENYANFHPGFNALFRGTRLTGLLSTLMGEEAVLFKEKINYKEAGGSGGFDAHIDASAYNHTGAIKHQTFLIAVDDMDMSNGCLEVVVGSHKSEISLGANRCIDPSWEESHTWIPVPLRAGSLLLFGSYLAHRSGPNSSPRARAAIYATYNGLSEGDKHDAYYAHRRRAWPPTNERVPGVDYTEGAITYAYGSPMTGGKEAIDAQLGLDKRRAEETVDKVFEVIKTRGNENYIGEKISQVEHCLQAAALARENGADDETVIAALLHDIGQFLPASTCVEMRSSGSSQSVGRMGHETIGATYLSSLGFPPRVCRLVGAHVVAKRYLTATRAGYFAQLSPASRASLEFQGGPFSSLEVEEFEEDGDWKEMVQLRLWDDAAKVEALVVEPLETYRDVAVGVLCRS